MNNDLRAEFEAWADSYGFHTERDHLGYESINTGAAWRGFQAARAAQPAAVPVGWISTVQCIGPDYGKQFFDKLPVQSLQPGFYKHTPLYTAPQPAAPVVPQGLSDKQRLHIDQGMKLLGDYAAENREGGTDSIADGCEAAIYVLGKLLAAAPQGAEGNG